MSGARDGAAGPRSRLEPASRLGARAYAVPRHGAPCDLRLDGNEGRPPREDLVRALDGRWSALLARYPDAAELERALAARHGVAPERVVVTAGADDALARLCQALLEPGREAVLPVPTFEMIARYAALAGGTVREVAWPDGPWPVAAILGAVGPRTALVFAVTPNNPTGGVIELDALRRVAAAAAERGALLVVDLAYVEFAAVDPTPALLELETVVVVRTLSKAWGLAGLRVGYALGPAPVVAWLRRAGHPYPVAGPALALALERLARGEHAVERFAATVAREREQLAATLRALGARPLPSEASFVLARFADAAWVRDALAGLGIAVRAFPDRPELADALRITCPGDADDLLRLGAGLRAALAPEVLLADEGALALRAAAVRSAVAVRGEAERAVRRALAEAGARAALMACSTPASVRAARAAGVVPLGVAPAGADAERVEALVAAGAARVLVGGAALAEVAP